MKNIVRLLFEARILKDRLRSGYVFLGTGQESIAEHSFMTAFICFLMAKTKKKINKEKLISMALIHDIAEARIGDVNYFEKKYSKNDEKKAVEDLIKDLSFGDEIKDLINEFNAKKTKESLLANDADQISFILELKKLKDTGSKGVDKWLPFIIERLETKTGKKIAKRIMETTWDEWWFKNYEE